MQHPRHPEPQETQSPKKPPNIHPNLSKSTQNPTEIQTQKYKKPELHLKSKPKIQMKPQIQKKSHNYRQEKEKNYSRRRVKSRAQARGATVAGAVLNQSDVAEFAGKAVGGARARRRGPQHRRSNSQTSKNSLGHVR